MFTMKANGLFARGRTMAKSAVLAAILASGAGAALAADITGAGATFPAPIYTKWGELYKAAGGAKLNYQSIGSGAGVTQIVNRTVDFGASDAPTSADKLSAADLVQFPAVVGSVVVTANVPGINVAALKLTGPLVADIYLGKVKMWNAPAIKALNPGVQLPATAIAPVYRSDGSGTTFVFTTYLSAVSPTWDSSVGADKSVAWKAGIGAKGNEGVAGAVKNTVGAIGYVEYAYASENKMPAAMLKNKSGKFVAPSIAAFSAAAATADWKMAQDMAASMIDTTGDANWPIVSATYILLPKKPTSAASSLEVMKFFDWAFKNGGEAATDLHYIPLPPEVTDRVRHAWAKQVKGSDGKAIWVEAKPKKSASR